jgi:DNA-binding NtrC family response regulator
LLRVIEERSFRRVGGVKNFQVDLRIIAATNADLARRVDEGRFRADLYYRLNVITIYLPPLKDRGDDIHLLAGHFLDYFNRSYRRDVKGFSEEAVRLLLAYPWPGNVRELRNAVERAVMISNGGYITPRDLNIERRGQARDVVVATPSGHPLISLPESGVGLDQIEKEAILGALNRCGWNVCKTARFLRISRQTLRYRMTRHGLSSPQEAVTQD